jgi:RNA polymerase sigma-70 factor (ECF subfamily)
VCLLCSPGASPSIKLVVIALAVNEVPIDVLAGRLGPTRGALYETLREARLAMRNGLSEASPDR